MRKQVWICIEKADANYSAYAPEVLGCAATGDSVEETKDSMTEALKFHLEGMLDDGDTLDAITGMFPEDEAAKNEHDQDYWALVHVDVVKPGARIETR